MLNDACRKISVTFSIRHSAFDIDKLSADTVLDGVLHAADALRWRLACEMPALRDAGCRPDEPFSAKLRDALLVALYASGSDLLILPVQDIFGWRDRVNTPAVVSDANWSWRLPFPVDSMTSLPEARERAGFLKQLALIHARVNP
jgi:4-alpha-glucanotransferase